MAYIEASLLFLVVGLAFYAIFYLWPAYCVDRARDEIFAARDKIFELAVNGDLSFEDKSYTEIRESLNRLIRFAHDLTLFKLVLLIAHKSDDAMSTRRLDEIVQDISNDEVREKVRKHVDDAVLSALRLMVFRSPILVCLALFYKVLRTIGAVRSFGRTARQRAIEGIQTGAEQYS